MAFQIAIVLYPGMTVLDAIGPYESLRMLPDSELRFVSNEVGPIVSDSGVLALGATHTFAETPSPDLVLVPGSEGATTEAMANRELIDWLRAVHETTQWTTSVCSGALVLAAADILRGHPATTHWLAQPMLATFGATSRPHDRIVRSGKIVTAAGVSAGIDLGLWLFGEIAGAEEAQIIQLALEYDPHPPFDCGHPDKAPAAILNRARLLMAKRAANPRVPLEIASTYWNLTLNRIRARAGR
ncbi:DJ-1/PfpI family protein [Nocardia huaxiensis]|uniref:DJ-1/PfpI family protein n=1 Tax=Nocardia huaxiensis TaxID=2755382 RepID=A0A7D6VHL2_9NOCA|nr:DJ-1/PfpI family protein [Nocardia huaxiensis]QLY33017.1 DJ-1/PfpI family protein [Nocardia huaxiensis]UFS93221.1 DJ-1/PfpI family protein [Nocardia huaxiensis]